MENNWHSIPIEKIFSFLKTTEKGLTTEEAKQRIKKYGLNILPQEKPLLGIRLFLRQFNNPLVYILLFAAVISLVLKHYSDTIFIIVVLLINTTVGFYQENKANKSLLFLKKMIKIKARVLRDDNEKELDSEELVPGDIILLRSGDKVPADGRILESKNFKVNEASLTGEWWAVEKFNDDKIKDSAPLAERNNMVFMGTIVEEGWAKIVITDTGLNSQLGEIVSLVKKTKEDETPLQKKIKKLSQWIGIFILSIVGIIIIEGYLTSKNFIEIFIASLALAVSAIPAGLLPAITVIMVLGMRRIFKYNGLVRKLSATETLGGVTVICTDKTGTLTEGKMQVSHILTGNRELLEENFKDIALGDKANGVESHIHALKIATLVNDSFIENPDSEMIEWIIRGRPTEKALLLAGISAGLNKKNLEKQYPLLDKIDFSSDYKFAANYHYKNERENVLYVLGAPEEIIKRCENIDIDGKKENLDGEKTKILLKKVDELTSKGLRVLACSHRDIEKDKRYEKLEELVEKLSLTGFIALKDPLRPDAKEAVNITKRAGIKTIIVTGDHKLTAKSIAEEIGIETSEENIIEGPELEKITDEELKEKIKNVSVCARVTPKHKLRIVDALQSNGEIVAMFGDGVNDAPALKSADIGVAVGAGTDVAKETADIVLMDNNFKTIVKAIEQGRVIFENIRKVFVYLVADDFSELFLFIASMFFGFPVPLLAAQILWINLVEDGFPDIALTTEQETKGLMEEKPRNPKEPILNKNIKLWLTAIFFITGLAAFLSFYFLWTITGDLYKTRNLVFVLMCVDSLIFAFCVRSFKRSIFRKDIFSNYYLNAAALISLSLLLAALYFPPLQKILHSQPIAAIEWIIILCISTIEILLIEFFKKKFFRGKENNNQLALKR